MGALVLELERNPRIRELPREIACELAACPCAASGFKEESWVQLKDQRRQWELFWTQQIHLKKQKREFSSRKRHHPGSEVSRFSDVFIKWTIVICRS